MADLIKTESNLTTDLNLLTDEQLMLETKFCHRRLSQNIIEYGIYLIEWKRRIPHGEFGSWLEKNFRLKERMARNFMQVAERFGKSEINFTFNSTQMIAMLALPKGEEEKFIAEQAANGNPVEDMTVNQLRAEVAEYKAELEKKNSEVTDLFAENKKLQEDKNGLSQIVKDSNNQIKELANEKGQLEKANLDLQNQLKNQKPTEKVVAQADYDDIKNQLAEKQKQIAELESQLSVKDTTIEVKQTAELDKAKKELADLQAKLDEYSKVAVIVQTFESIAGQAESIIFNPFIGKGLAYYEKININAYNKARAILKDFVELLGDDD